MSSAPIVIALGGHSLVDPALEPTVAAQFETTAQAMLPIADLIEANPDVKLVLTHGNGPQVGYMQRRAELALGELHDVPLDSLVANTQGSLGYMIQRILANVLSRRNINRRVVTIVTEVLVNADDPALANPSKPIGSFFTKEQAEEKMRDAGWTMIEDAGRGWRRVVPSPRPTKVLQLPEIKALSDAGVIVVTCGGGGIPVVEREVGGVRGIPGVVDKDRASGLLAHELGAETLVITTEVDHVMEGFLSDNPKALPTAGVAQLRELSARGEFPPGSMGPKVEASCDFVDAGGQRAIICRPGHLLAAIEGKAGTTVS